MYLRLIIIIRRRYTKSSLLLHIRSSDSLATLNPNPVLDLTLSLLPITSGHSYDSTFDYW